MPHLNFENGNLILQGLTGAQGAQLKDELGARDGDAGWVLPPTSLNVLRAVEVVGTELLEGAPEDVRDLAEQPWGFRGFSPEELEAAQAHPSWDTLFPHQRSGVEYLFCNPHAAGLALLRWGLGKGATAVVAADLIQARRVLVLAPLTLATAWKGEHTRWAEGGGGEQPFKRATAEDPAPLEEGWTVTNHETIQELVLRDETGAVIQPEWARNARKVKEWIQEGPTKVDAKGKKVPVRERITRVRRDYLETEWDLIIVDESVLLKNRKAVKASVLNTLRKKNDPFVWMLSASPTTKFRDDLHKQLEILMPRAFRSYWRTAEFFCTVDKGGWGWTIEGDRGDRDPDHYLRDFIWKPEEEELEGIELPEYREEVVLVDPTKSQRKALDQMMREWIVELEEEPEGALVAANWLSRSTRLQQITSNMAALPKADGELGRRSASAKEDLLIDLIKGEEIETPLLVWTWFTETTRQVAARLEKETDLRVSWVTGELSSKEKDARILAYKEGELDALVLQIGVGKFGHTFTDTRTIFYHDRTFDSDAYVQSRHRVRRLGLKHRPALIVPKIENSADELIDANLEGKMRSVADLTNMDLAELLRSVLADEG